MAGYLTVRRALGFKLVDAGLLLEQFADHAEAVGVDAVTTDLALLEPSQPRPSSPPADQLQPDLVLLRRRQEPIRAPTPSGQTARIGHDQILLNSWRNLGCCLIDTPVSTANSAQTQTR